MSAAASPSATASTFSTGRVDRDAAHFVSNRAGEVKYGTTGKPVPGYDVRLVDDDGEVIQTRGEMGELQVRGPTSAVMYWNNR